MKVSIWILMLFVSINLMAAYVVGDTIPDYSWTDDSGETHSVHELTAAGKVVVMDWGGYG